MTVKVQLGARKEQREAFDWYRKQSVQAVGRFLEGLGTVIQRIGAAPQQFPRISESHRRARLDTFPYSVVFEVTATAIMIVAICHTSAAPVTGKAADSSNLRTIRLL